MCDAPGCSTNNSELDLLQDVGVNVWGQKQETLEQQALQELTTFSNNYNKTLADDKLSESNDERVEQYKLSIVELDITSYIKKQEDLKKKQDYRRSSQISHRSKLIADQINNKQQGKSNKVRKQITEKKQLKFRQDDIEAQKNVKDDFSIENKHYGKEHVVRKLRMRKRSSIYTENNDGNKKNLTEDHNEDNSGSEYAPSEIDSDYEPSLDDIPSKRRKPTTNKSDKNCTGLYNDETKAYVKIADDGDIKCYQERLNKYYETLELANQIAFTKGTELPETEVTISNGFKTSSKIWNSLYSYQHDGVEWLWTIHQKITGGLLGDEMGLGKTVQIIAFLYSLNYSGNISSHGGYKGLGPTLILCPSTVIHQWVSHFHEWAPEFRVSVLHQSGTYPKSKHKLIKENITSKGILVTTYQSMLKYKNILLEQHWHYIILDEGHKIRNPTAKISEAVKLFKTPYRLLLTGSPMQNNLQELWSLFDFVNPGMLGTLPVFMEHFAMPIMQGGYTNASPMQESLALSMATALKNMITPHFLRRAKTDVIEDIQLPNKSEQVLFCSITQEQRDLYLGYLMSDHINNILGRGSKNWFSENHTRANVLMSITTLRKICNHPDIYLSQVEDDDETGITNEHFGSYKRSGKMIVVAALLKMWKKQKHRVLLFTQGRAMIGIFERFLQANDYKYLKMDGGTSIGGRQPLINKFNNDNSYDVFLLTTRVGGLGVNLTGADRVIIYDPDWNPATDTQARERAWRIGQDKEVTIYRLLSAGTIEEKMYQRQIWKQLLSNKVLLDPKTQRFFKSSDLHDLFSLQDYVDSKPETSNIFQKSRISLEEKIRNKKKKLKDSKVTFSEDKLEKMKQLAAQISKNISKTLNNDEEPILDPLQKELLEEREDKLKDRAELKKLTPSELLQYNRDKLKMNDTDGNQLDDCDTDVNFTKALIISEKAAGLYKSAKSSTKHVEKATESYRTLTSVFAKDKKSRHKRKEHSDISGRIDGEVIEGLVKRQSKKKEKSTHIPVKHQQDSYVLGKLFSKKGVQSALEHDNVIQGTSGAPTSLKIQTETQTRTDIALQALRQSRINNWKW